MSKILCKSCGAENDVDAKFCKNCGANLNVVEAEREEPEKNEVEEIEVFSPPVASEKPKKKLKKRVIIPLVIFGLILIFLLIPSNVNVTALDIQYVGSREEGIVLDENNEGFKVVGLTDDGSEVEITGWTVEEPQTFVADEKSKVIINYKDLSYEVELECSTSELVSIAADYSGSTDAGIVLDTENEGIHVEATYKNGNTEVVEGFQIDKSATLEAGKTSTVKISYEGLECELKVECTSMTLEQYKGMCKSIAYEDLARNPDKYQYQFVKFTGKVVQTMEEGSAGALRVNVTKDSYGYYEDTVYVLYEIDNANRILEDDIVSFYGFSMGLMSYETVLGATVTIPEVYAEYVVLD